MRARPAAFLLAALLLSGCMSFLACPGCDKLRYAEGVEPDLFDALAAANVSGVKYGESHPYGFAFDARLPGADTGRGGYRLQRVQWLPDGPDAPRGASAWPYPGSQGEDLSVRVEVPAGGSREDVRAVLDAFLPQVHEANESVRQRALDDLLTFGGPSHSTSRRSAVFQDPDVPLDAYGTLVRGPHLVAQLHERLVGASTPTLLPPDHWDHVGSFRVEAGEWDLLYSLPVRSVDYAGDGLRILLKVDGRGTYVAQAESAKPMRGGAMQDAFERALVEKMHVPGDVAKRIPIRDGS